MTRPVARQRPAFRTVVSCLPECSALIGFLLLVIVLVALSLGWQPVATFQRLVGIDEPDRDPAHYYNSVVEYQRKQAVEDAERQRQARQPYESPKSPHPPEPASVPLTPAVSEVTPPVYTPANPDNGPSFFIPAPPATVYRREGAGTIHRDLFQSDLPGASPSATPGRKQE